MDKIFGEETNKNIIKNNEQFISKLKSNIIYKNNLSSNSMSFDWVDEIEMACPYIDNIVRNPKLTLITEENTIKIEKSKMITVASIKDLSKHTQYIGKIDKKTNDIQPSKILDVRKEETFNIYENRFLYTLLNNLTKFLMKQEDLLNEFEVQNDKMMKYSGESIMDGERVNIELKVTSNTVKEGEDNSNFESEIKSVRIRLERIKDYMSSWRRSDLIKALSKAHVGMVTSPIKKTNLILKNPSFQICTKLWYFLQKYSGESNDAVNMDVSVAETLQSVLDHSSLIDYCVFECISKSKREQKKALKEYSLSLVEEELNRLVSLLLKIGVKITDEDILTMFSRIVSDKKNKQFINDSDVKNKFKSAMDEYLEKTQDYL